MVNTIGKLHETEGKTRTTEKIILACRQVYRIQNHGKDLQIQGVRGMVYVTLPDDPADYLLSPGEEVIVRSRGLVLVQGMPEGVFRYSAE